MAQSEPAVLDLLFSAGFTDARNPDISASDKIAGGLLWCIAAVNALGPQSDVAPHDNSTLQDKKMDVGKDIEEALHLMECPHSFQASQIQDLDYEGIYPVVQWIVGHLQKVRDESKDKVTHNKHSIEDDHSLLQHMEESKNVEIRIMKLNAKLEELNQRKVDVLNEMKELQERINREGANTRVQRLSSLLEMLKVLERQESDFLSSCNAKQTKLEADVSELEQILLSGRDEKSLLNVFDLSLHDSIGKLNSAKMALASKLRAIVFLKRQIDDTPSQGELIQYERRFTELNAHIQGKLRQTRKYYATFNALLEIKELMLKETSLLNSISSQFQDAISSSAGRTKLIDSMEGILMGIKQKVEKVQLELHSEQKVCNALKEKYAAAISEQRHCSSLLKAFQEECAKNERFRSRTSVILI